MGYPIDDFKLYRSIDVGSHNICNRIFVGNDMDRGILENIIGTENERLAMAQRRYRIRGSGNNGDRFRGGG